MNRRLAGILLLCGVCHATAAQASEAAADIDGESIFLGRCGLCHELPDPGALTPTQWRAVLRKMQKRMEFLGVPPLTAGENEQVLEWLTTNQNK